MTGSITDSILITILTGAECSETGLDWPGKKKGEEIRKACATRPLSPISFLASTTAARRSRVYRRPSHSGDCLLESSCVAGVQVFICSQSSVSGAQVLPRARRALSSSVAVRPPLRSKTSSPSSEQPPQLPPFSSSTLIATGYQPPQYSFPHCSLFFIAA
ncbi:uncharacterized protein DS421_13g397720 [Arachis hypogaea]|nr:uncharacterized protein DS421_13g397720 [Arachis hypogaea]